MPYFNSHNSYQHTSSVLIGKLIIFVVLVRRIIMVMSIVVNTTIIIIRDDLETKYHYLVRSLLASTKESNQFSNVVTKHLTTHTAHLVQVQNSSPESFSTSPHVSWC